MPSRWSLRLVRRLAVGWVFGIIWAAVRIDAVFAGAGCSGGGGVIMNRPSPSRVRVSGPLQAYAAGFREELSSLGYSAVGRRASAADGAFKSVAGRDRFGPGRIDPAAD